MSSQPNATNATTHRGLYNVTIDLITKSCWHEQVNTTYLIVMDPCASYVLADAFDVTSFLNNETVTIRQNSTKGYLAPTQPGNSAAGEALWFNTTTPFWWSADLAQGSASNSNVSLTIPGTNGTNLSITLGFDLAATLQPTSSNGTYQQWKFTEIQTLD